jgi:hypothetical protein
MFNEGLFGLWIVLLSYDGVKKQNSLKSMNKVWCIIKALDLFSTFP